MIKPRKYPLFQYRLALPYNDRFSYCLNLGLSNEKGQTRVLPILIFYHLTGKKGKFYYLSLKIDTIFHFPIEELRKFGDKNI